MGRRVARLAAVFAAGALAVVALGGCGASAERDVTVAAASNLRPQLDSAVAAWTQAGGEPVTVVYGSSLQLVQQRDQGAPYDVLMVADAQVLSAADRAHAQVFAEGQLVVWSPEGTLTLDDLVGLDRVVIAHPDHAPFGRAARETLQDAGWWDALGERLIYATSESQAAVLARSGEVDAALLASTSIVPMQTQPVDPATYQPLCQAVVVAPQAPAAAHAFTAFWAEFVAAGLEGEVSASRCGP